MSKKKNIYGYTLGSGCSYHIPDKFEKVTLQGYPVKNTFRDKNGRKYIVGQRSVDYFVGNGYDSNDGTWAQGYYGFPTRQSAINFAKHNAYRRKKWWC